MAMATTPAATTPSVPAVDGTGPAQGSIAVQLASLTEQPDLAAYAAVAPLGTVYSSVGPNGRYRIRMGPVLPIGNKRWLRCARPLTSGIPAVSWLRKMPLP